MLGGVPDFASSVEVCSCWRGGNTNGSGAFGTKPKYAD
jgi:hypothetical protein